MENLAQYFEGSNFMTPDVIKYGHIDNNRVYELSTGTGFNNNEIYGVTIRTKHDAENCDDLSQMCVSLEDAERYIKDLQEG